RIGPAAEYIVQLQEVDDPLPPVAECRVEYPRGMAHAIARVRQKVGNRLRCQLGHHNGGCFERLEEAGRQSQRAAVVGPQLATVSGVDGNFAECELWRQIAARTEIGVQLLQRGLLRYMVAGEYVTNTAPRGQADIPDPAGRLRRRQRRRCN